MDKVEKWEIAGVPAALAFEAAMRMGLLDGISAEQLPHLMVLAFIAMAALRAGMDYVRKTKEDDAD